METVKDEPKRRGSVAENRRQLVEEITRIFQSELRHDTRMIYNSRLQKVRKIKGK